MTSPMICLIGMGSLVFERAGLEVFRQRLRHGPRVCEMLPGARAGEGWKKGDQDQDAQEACLHVISPPCLLAAEELVLTFTFLRVVG